MTAHVLAELYVQAQHLAGKSISDLGKHLCKQQRRWSACASVQTGQPFIISGRHLAYLVVEQAGLSLTLSKNPSWLELCWAVVIKGLGIAEQRFLAFTCRNSLKALCCVLEKDTLVLKLQDQHRKARNRPDMTETLLTDQPIIKAPKQTHTKPVTILYTAHLVY